MTDTIPDPREVGRALLGADRVPYDALLRLGHKDERTGNPTGNKGWEIAERALVMATFKAGTGSEFKSAVHQRHPRFALWNDLPERDRSSVHVRITGVIKDVVAFGRFAKKAPAGTGGAPTGSFWCASNDLKRRVRWEGDAYLEGECPGAVCQYTKGTKPPCGPKAVVYGVIEGIPGASDGPPLTVRLRTHAWSSSRGILDMLEGLGGVDAVKGMLVRLDVTSGTRRSPKIMPCVVEQGEGVEATKPEPAATPWREGFRLALITLGLSEADAAEEAAKATDRADAGKRHKAISAQFSGGEE